MPRTILGAGDTIVNWANEDFSLMDLIFSLEDVLVSVLQRIPLISLYYIS